MLAFWIGWALAQEVEDPTGPAARLQQAELLLAESNTEEEARDVLLALLMVPELRAVAREQLLTLLSEERARVGWSDNYRYLRGDRQLSQEQRDLFTLRFAQAPPWNGPDRRRAIGYLNGAKPRLSENPSMWVAYGHLYLLEGNAGKALAYFREAGSNEGALGEAYALLALGKSEEIQGEIRDPDIMLAAALSNPTPANRARALFDGGYGYLARKVAGSASSCKEDACVALAEIQDAKGDYRQEVNAWRAWLRQKPGDEGARLELLQALLDSRDLRGARSLAGQDEGMKAIVQAVTIVTTMRSTMPLEERDRLTEEALGLSGLPWQVRLARARVLTEQKRYEEAVNLLLPVTDRRGGDPAVLWAYAEAGIRLGEEREVLELWRTATRRAISVERRRQLGVDLAVIHAIIGEWHKGEGRLGDALTSYQTAVSMQPGRASFYSGVGGVLWQGRRQEEARRAYLTALSLDPSDHDALAAAATLSVLLADPDSAESLIKRAKITTPAIARARELVRSARAIAEAHAATRAERSDALARLARLREGNADNPDVLQAIGNSYLELQAAREALAVFRQAQRYRQDDPWLRVGELSALISIPDLDAAEALLAELEATDMDAEVLRGARIALLRARGNESALAGNAALALEFYQQVLELDRRDGWTWVALGDLYLAQARPASAMAYYNVALDRDQPRDLQRELAAQKGMLRCYVALGRLAEAQEWIAQPWGNRLDAAEKSLLEREIRLALLEQQLAAKDYAGARNTLRKAEQAEPGSAFVFLLRGRISLAEEDPEQAWTAALAALGLDPGMVAAAELLLESAPLLDRESRAVEALRTAWQLSASEEIRVRMEDARFNLAERKIYGHLAKGNLAAALALLDELEGEGEPGRETRIAAMYTALGRGKIAQEILDGALEEAPDYAPALLGRAELLLWQGRPAQAESWLATSFERTGAAELGLRRVELLLEQRRKKAAKEQLEAVERLAPDDDWDNRLPLTPLPDGSRPPVEPITGLPKEDGGTLGRIEALKERMDAPVRPDVAAGYRFMHQSGSVGSTRLFGHALPVSLQRLPVGPVDLRVDLLPIWLGDGQRQNLGMGLDAGLSFDRGPVGASGVLGISPLGFLGGATVVWDARAWYEARGVVAGLRTGRSPITDSLSSWGGGLAEDGTLFGLVSWTWLGAWGSFQAPSGFLGGAWLKVGVLDGLQLEPLGRQELGLWGSRRLGTLERHIDIYAAVDYMAHDRQVDAFDAGEAGAFTPSDFFSVRGGATGGIDSLGGIALCGGASLGMQATAGTDTAYLGTGIYPAVDIGAGVTVPLGDWFWLGAGAGWQALGSGWTQETASLSVGYAAEGEKAAPLSVSEAQGSRPARGDCR